MKVLKWIGGVLGALVLALLIVALGWWIYNKVFAPAPKKGPDPIAVLTTKVDVIATGMTGLSGKIDGLVPKIDAATAKAEAARAEAALATAKAEAARAQAETGTYFSQNGLDLLQKATGAKAVVNKDGVITDWKVSRLAMAWQFGKLSRPTTVTATSCTGAGLTIKPDGRIGTLLAKAELIEAAANAAREHARKASETSEQNGAKIDNLTGMVQGVGAGVVDNGKKLDSQRSAILDVGIRTALAVRQQQPAPATARKGMTLRVMVPPARQ